MRDRPRRRRWPIVLSLLVALLIAGFFAARHYTQPETLTALLIDKARSELGADLHIAETGRFELTPKLHLTLRRPSLGEIAKDAHFLDAESIDVVVPWKTLWSDRYEIERIELVKPRVDLDALNAWLASRPSSTQTPDIRFSLRVSGASLVSHGKTIADGVDLDFASAGDIGAWLARSGTAPALLPPLSGTAQIERIEIGDTKLENVRIEASDDARGHPLP